jgi:hypothetical protein
VEEIIPAVKGKAAANAEPDDNDEQEDEEEVEDDEYAFFVPTRVWGLIRGQIRCREDIVAQN